MINQGLKAWRARKKPAFAAQPPKPEPAAPPQQPQDVGSSTAAAATLTGSQPPNPTTPSKAPAPTIPHSFHNFVTSSFSNAPTMTILFHFLTLVALLSLTGCDWAEGAREHLTALVYSDLSQPSASKFQASPANFSGTKLHSGCWVI